MIPQLNFNNSDWRRKFDLIVLLTQKEISLKYKRTVLGIFWSALNPILMSIVFFVAFKVFMRFKVENYTFFLLSAIFPWTWFSTSLITCSRSFVDNVSLIKKIIFPRPYLVISALLAQFVNLLMAFIILAVLSVVYTTGPNWVWIIGIPLLSLIQFIFIFGISLAVATLNTYFRDTEYLIGVGMNLIFWMTPITYPLSSIPEKYHSLILLNPLASLIFSWRELFLYNHLLWDKIAIATLTSFLFLGLGYWIYYKLSQRLDEVL